MNERQKLLQKVQMYDFALDDIALFLDTHPYDQDALTQYGNYLALYEQARKEYVTKCGPLMQEDYQEGSCWKWIDNPWPWDYER